MTPTSSTYDYIIIGFGASGIHLTLAMLEDPFFTSKRILILEKNQKDTNDKTWCFWERKNKNFAFPIKKSWSSIVVKSPEFQATLPLGDLQYYMVNSKEFYSSAKDKIKASSNITMIQDEIMQVVENKDCVKVYGKQNLYTASFIFSSVMDYPIHKGRHPWLNQHFGGWFIKSPLPVFKGKNPSFMNFDIPQDGATRFMYELPLNDFECLFEFTIFSEEPYAREQYEQFLSVYLTQQNIDSYTISEKEFGVIPMTSYPFWRHNTTRTMYIGTAGGWTKPSTGYTFYFCQKYATQLVDFLKSSRDMRKFSTRSVDDFLDRILLGVLSKHNQLGAEIFSSMFQQNDVHRILRFLNNDSTWWDKIIIVSKTKYPVYFFTSLLHILLKR